jgi:hypothetical protein
LTCYAQLKKLDNGTAATQPKKKIRKQNYLVTDRAARTFSARCTGIRKAGMTTTTGATA